MSHAEDDYIHMATFVRVVVSAACLPLLYWASQAFGCRWVSFTWPVDYDTVLACSEPGLSAISGWMAAAGALVAVLLILTLTWLPVVRRRRSNMDRVQSSLSENLQRASLQISGEAAMNALSETDHSAIRAAAAKAMVVEAPRRPQNPTAQRVETPPAPVPQTATVPTDSAATAPAESNTGNELRKSISGLKTRVDMLEEALEADTLSAKQAMHEWVGLLKDCNQAHNSGKLPSSIFKDLNTRLLDLFTTQPSENPPHS